jgi:hypothetical protein
MIQFNAVPIIVHRGLIARLMDVKREVRLSGNICPVHQCAAKGGSRESKKQNCEGHVQA